ncbi:hypothetical protein D3C77_316980 [compost metagenome]
MSQNGALRREVLQLYVDAAVAFIPMDLYAEYYIMNPEMLVDVSRQTMWEILNTFHIRNEDELRKDIAWTIAVGRRLEFARTCQQLSILSEAERNKFIEEAETAQDKHKRAVANYYLRRMPPGGIGAYDFSYAVFKCLGGRQLKCLSEDEMWGYIGSLANLMRNSYSNWYDYTMGFAVGFEYFSPEMSQTYLSADRQRLMRLLNLRKSPLLQIRL